MYDLNKINEFLNTDLIGRTIIQYDSLDSTYSKAKNIFSTCPDGSVVLSEHQSKWCIRMGKEWICYPNRNIYLSIILKPSASHLTSKFDVMGCVAIWEALRDLYGLDCKIKWPNDILIGNKKVSSVNSSLVSKNNMPDGIIISLGINTNINKEELELSEEIKENSTSLLIETSSVIDREILIGEILNHIEKYYNEMIKDNKAERVVAIFNENSTFINEDIEIMKKGKKSKRIVYSQGIDAEGCLCVISDKGIKEILSPGETIII